jgi:hypothetical protein
MNVFNWHPGAGESVVTEYFWIYLGIAGGSAFLTVTTWCLITHHDEKKLNKRIQVDSTV